MNHVLTLGASAIRELDGLYSLNDLHRAAGGEKRHQPSDFLRLAQTQALIEELKTGNSRFIEITRGRNAKALDYDEMVVSFQNLPARIAEPGAMIPSDDLLALMIAVSKRLAGRLKTAKGSSALPISQQPGRMTAQMLRGRFEKARRLAAKSAETSGAHEMAADIRNFQFRDLRAKAGSDKVEATGSMVEAQKLLGHASPSTTEIYVRHRRGALVKPTR